MASIDPYTVRFRLDDMIERGAEHTVRAPVFDVDGSQLTPTSATFSLYKPGRTAVLSGEVATIEGDGTPAYTISAGALTSQGLGKGWYCVWAITLDDGTVVRAENAAALVRRALLPVTALQDLYDRLPTLNPTHSAAMHDDASLYVQQLYEAWVEVQKRLMRLGNRPNLILNPSELREPVRDLAIAMILQTLATGIHQHYRDLSTEFRGYYESAWGELRFEYDDDDDGKADGAGRRAAQPTTWLCDLGEPTTTTAVIDRRTW